MISQDLLKLIGEAMKAHDTVRVSTLRMLLSEFKNEKINLQHDLTDEEELKVLRREAKKRKEAIEMYIKANEENRAENEKQELTILQEFLPAEVSEEQIIQLINDSVIQLNAKTLADMGKVITDVKSKNSNVDGAIVAQIVRQKLT